MLKYTLLKQPDLYCNCEQQQNYLKGICSDFSYLQQVFNINFYIVFSEVQLEPSCVA